MALAVLLLAATATAQGAEFNTYLNAAVRLYESLEYERALENLEKAKRLSRGVADDVSLSLYEGIVKLDLGQTDQGGRRSRPRCCSRRTQCCRSR